MIWTKFYPEHIFFYFINEIIRLRFHLDLKSNFVDKHFIQINDINRRKSQRNWNGKEKFNEKWKGIKFFAKSWLLWLTVWHKMQLWLLMKAFLRVFVAQKCVIPASMSKDRHDKSFEELRTSSRCFENFEKNCNGVKRVCKLKTNFCNTYQSSRQFISCYNRRSFHAHFWSCLEWFDFRLCDISWFKL